MNNGNCPGRQFAAQEPIVPAREYVRGSDPVSQTGGLSFDNIYLFIGSWAALLQE